VNVFFVYPPVIYGVFVHRLDYLKKKHIVAKDMVGLLLGVVVSTKKRHIVAKDVVGLQVGDSKNKREFD
jgi:hypothetical protein